MKPVVKFNNVSKTYSLFKKKSDQLLEVFSFKNNKRKFSALSNITFEVYKGETIGIIGVNGSGKSTLSSLLAQVTLATSGDIWIDGETSLVAISAGLNNHLTGLENIELKCLMHGMKKSDIQKITPDIIEFADIGDFIDQPIKSYSSGMKSRLGFAISVHIQPDILVVDEALSVGDSTFYQKCLDKFDEFKAQGKTIFFISHSLSQVQAISDRIMWLNFGQIKTFAANSVVAKEYKKFIKWFNDLNKQQQKEYRKNMLNGQMKEKDIYSPDKETTSPRRSMNRRKKKSKAPLILQVSFFTILFMLSTMLMFVNHPVEAITDSINNFSKDNVDDRILDEKESDEPNHVKVDENGFISEREAILYNDTGLNKSVTGLPFATEVYVEEKIDNSIYKVKTKSDHGYIDSTKVETAKEEELKHSNLSLEEFVSIFPDEFAGSYAFSFTYLNTDYAEVKDSLQGLTNEYVDDFGQSILDFSSNRMSYIFDENNISNAIKVSDINVDAPIIHEIITESKLVSGDKVLYLLLTKDFKIYLDVENRTITFRE